MSCSSRNDRQKTRVDIGFVDIKAHKGSEQVVGTADEANFTKGHRGM